MGREGGGVGGGTPSRQEGGGGDTPPFLFQFAAGGKFFWLLARSAEIFLGGSKVPKNPFKNGSKFKKKLEFFLNFLDHTFYKKHKKR